MDQNVNKNKQKEKNTLYTFEWFRSMANLRLAEFFPTTSLTSNHKGLYRFKKKISTTNTTKKTTPTPHPPTPCQLSINKIKS